MNYTKESLKKHAKWGGKIEVISTVPCRIKEDLSLAYIPGVAQPCLKIQQDINKSYELTRHHNLRAVITDRTGAVYAGRSDYPNQINNVLAFPGIFCGTFDVRASDINEQIKVVAAMALANLISDEELNENYIIPVAFDERVGPAVAKAAADTDRKTGVARI